MINLCQGYIFELKTLRQRLENFTKACDENSFTLIKNNLNENKIKIIEHFWSTLEKIYENEICVDYKKKYYIKFNFDISYSKKDDKYFITIINKTNKNNQIIEYIEISPNIINGFHFFI